MAGSALAALLCSQTVYGSEFTSHSKPFDLVWSTSNGVDANGFPINPIWASQISDNGHDPVFESVCGGQVPPNCTSQSTFFDPEGQWFGHIFGECPSDPIDGHVDWRGATDFGFVHWQENSGGWPNDNDDNMQLDPIGQDGAALTSLNHGTVGLEFDAGETTDVFGDPFWQTGNLGHEFNGELAVVSGLLGIDGVHGGYVEIHPVTAIAVLTSSSMSGNLVTETWQYFIRNFGDEGGCSSYTHIWSGNHGVYYLTIPTGGRKPLSVTSLNYEAWRRVGGVGLPFVAGTGAASTRSQPTSSNPMQTSYYISIGVVLPNPSQQQACEDGYFTIQYTVPTATAGRRSARMAKTTTGGAPLGHEEEGTKPRDAIAGITDAATREKLQAIIDSEKPVTPHLPPDMPTTGKVKVAALKTTAVLGAADVERLSADHPVLDVERKQRNDEINAKIKAELPDLKDAPAPSR